MKVKMKHLPYQILNLSKYKRVRLVCINLFPSNISAKSTNSHVLFDLDKTTQLAGAVPSVSAAYNIPSHILFSS